MAKMVISGGYRSGSPQDALRNEWGPGAAQLDRVSPLVRIYATLFGDSESLGEQSDDSRRYLQGITLLRLTSTPLPLTPDSNRPSATGMSTARLGCRGRKLGVFIRPPAIHDTVGGNPASVIRTNTHRPEPKPAGNECGNGTDIALTDPSAVSKLAAAIGAPAVCLIIGRYPAAMITTYTHHPEGETS